ncbi:MAG: L-threonylcarbamoyladenylate synthase [Phycisphaerae bacterium]|nr:L-threonylcarbamoyladenylate synthase [Phycisphaerae bacterium]
METIVLKINSEKPEADTIRRAAAVIDSGGLVAFPTETVYGIGCAVNKDSLERLSLVKSRGAEKFYTLHIGDKAQLERYVPKPNLRVRKLVQNVWPGPVTIVFELDEKELAAAKEIIGREVFASLYSSGSIGVRCPANAVSIALLCAVKSAVVAPSANISGENPAVNAQQVIEKLDGKIDMVLDGGQCEYKKSSTVVKINKKGKLEILREGLYPKEDLEALSKVRFLFVCTGNTCRSPMAVGIFVKYWAEIIGCTVDQLEQNGYKVLSAGTMGIRGLAATAEATCACAARGIDITSHKSEALSKQLVGESDFIFVMTRGHLAEVLRIDPNAEGKIFLLDERDIPDPVGQNQDIYDRCAEQIECSIRRRMDELIK